MGTTGTAVKTAPPDQDLALASFPRCREAAMLGPIVWHPGLESIAASLANQRRRDPALDVVLGIVGNDPDVLDNGPAVDPDAFVALVRSHRLVPLVARALGARPPRRVPEAAARTLAEEHRQAALRALAIARGMIDLTTRLETNGVPCLVVKGPVLAMQAFGELGARTYLDLDVAIRPSDADRATAELRELGFASAHDTQPWVGPRVLDATGELGFRHPGRQLTVDLHVRLGPNLSAFSLPIEDAFARSVTLEIASKPVRTLNPELTVAYLCQHSAKHNWGALGYVAELAALLHRSPPHPERLCELAGRVVSPRILGVGLALAAQIAGAALAPGLAAYASRAVDTAAVRAWAIAAARWVEPRPHWLSRTRPRSLLDNDVYFHLLNRLDRLRYLVRRTVVPNSNDWSMLELPGPLDALYTPLRFVRLAARELGIAGNSPHDPRANGG